MQRANPNYLKWIDRNLELGDEINIKIVEVSQVDKPISEKRELASFVEDQQRQYYEKLKQKYENQIVISPFDRINKVFPALISLQPPANLWGFL
ncbi:hypothetical protein [Calothrix sp. CCY 0018]|uniref:hypothetical protein n=1 Tax=Calothrix sp. CCY 0018 TaxID=3103864 RepID=UPI0039C685CC